MSYFTETTGETKPTTPEATPETLPEYLAKVVEEKGEKWKDPNEVAKGYLSAQDHIKAIEAENAELRKASEKADFMEEVLTKFGKQTTPTSGEPVQTTSTGTETTERPSEVSVEQIKSLVTAAITEEETKRTTAQNLELVDSRLTELFGTEAASRVEAKRSQLGMSKERLAEIAQESPTAFFALIGEAPAKDTNALPTSSVNTSTDSFNRDQGKRTWSYYQAMRKDPKTAKLYRSAKVQNQMLEDSSQPGFYDT